MITGVAWECNSLSIKFKTSTELGETSSVFFILKYLSFCIIPIFRYFYLREISQAPEKHFKDC